MLVERTSDGDSQRLTFELPEPTATRPSLLPYLIPKGYVTIDGASLTITGVDDAKRRFSIMLIQHTQEKNDRAVNMYPGKKSVRRRRLSETQPRTADTQGIDGAVRVER